MPARIAVLLLALIAAAAPAAPYRIETVASGLDHPWSIAFLPDGRQLVTERPGRLWILDNGKRTQIHGVPRVLAVSQGGLFDALPHPDFARNGLIYLSYAAGSTKINSTHVARVRLEGDRLRDLQVIFQTNTKKDTPVHYGGKMLFLPDGTLLLTVGDGFDYREKAQLLASGLGKVVRMTDSGGVPADNPFLDRKAVPLIWTLGHRNPQGLARDPVTGRIYESEHGPRGGDEINLLAAGSNYGWPAATHGLDYSGATISPYTSYKGMVDPLVVWTPSIGPSGLAVYRGAMFPEWNGDLLSGALAIPQVRRVDLDAAGKVVGQARVFPEIDERVRDVRVAPDGAIWITTDSEEGRVLRISR